MVVSLLFMWMFFILDVLIVDNDVLLSLMFYCLIDVVLIVVVFVIVIDV